jgi:segregation and condensation protein B
MTTDAKIESLLFFKTDPVSVKELAKMLSISEGEVMDGLQVLEKNLEGRGVCLLKKDDSVMLGTSAEMSPVIESLIKEELNRDLGRAGLETLAIVLYRGPILKSEIDYIRGVNSGFILRNLLVRGLVEKEQNPAGRGFIYKPTFDLIQHLGVAETKQLPDFEEINNSLTAGIKQGKSEPDEEGEAVVNEEVKI